MTKKCEKCGVEFEFEPTTKKQASALGVSTSFEPNICDACEAPTNAHNIMRRVSPFDDWDSAKGSDKIRFELQAECIDLEKNCLKSAVIVGESGRCKSRSIGDLIDRSQEYFKCAWIDECDLGLEISTICAGKQPDNGHQTLKQFFDYIMFHDVIVIDDLGTAKITDRVGREICALWNRLSRDPKTVVLATSNSSIEQLRANYLDSGKRIVERIQQKCKVVSV